MPLYRKTWLLLALAFWPGPARAEVNCGGLFGALLGIPAKIADSAKTYVREVRENPLRILVKDRKDPDQFHFRILLDPFTAPAYLPSEALKWKKEATMPTAALVAGIPTSAATYMALDAHAQGSLKKDAGTIPGSAYLLGLAQVGLEDDSSLLEKASGQVITYKRLSEHAGDIRAWYSDPDGKTHLPRIEEFRRLGILDTNEAAHLDGLAYNAYRATLKENPAQEKFESTLLAHLATEFQGDPAFHARPAMVSLLMTTFVPVVHHGGKTDVAVIAQILGLRQPARTDLQALFGKVSFPELLRSGWNSPSKN